VRPGIVAATAVLAACSALPTVDNGIVAIELRTPTAVTLQQGDTLQLLARAVNAAGDSVPAGIVWHTLDTALVALDSTSGLLVAQSDSGRASVQAAAGSLRSALITLTLTPVPADTGGGTGSARIR
jgi:hypothetical protein